MSDLEKLSRMLTSNIGTPVPFDDAMIAAALRVAHGPDIAPHVSSAFLLALAEAFAGEARPRANIRAGRKGKQAGPVNALGVSDEARAVHDFITDEFNLHEVNGVQEELIEKAVAGDWPGGKAMSRGTIMDHLKGVRAARLRVLSHRTRRRGNAQSS